MILIELRYFLALGTKPEGGLSSANVRLASIHPSRLGNPRGQTLHPNPFYFPRSFMALVMYMN